jgi:dTDP-4-amino-4,6-dideoxygalactose transaminase
MEFIDLKSQYQRLKADIDAGIQRVLDHGQYILGPEVAELEEKLAPTPAPNTASPWPTAPMPCKLPKWHWA